MYQLIEDYTCDFTGGPMDPKGFAIHWWGDPAQHPTFYAIVNVLLTRSAQKSASVNFVAEDSLVACLVDPFTVAWAQGDGATGWGNNNLVSIECNPRCTAGDRETVAELIADQHIKNGIPIVLYPHKNFTQTDCPGVWEQWIPWLTDRANQIVAEKTNGTYGNGVDEMAGVDTDRLNAAVDRILGRDVQRYFNPTTGEVKGEPSPGFIPARSSDVHDVISTNNLIVSQINKVLDAVSKIPGVDSTVIAGLRQELSEELKAATANLSVTLSTTP